MGMRKQTVVPIGPFKALFESLIPNKSSSSAGGLTKFDSYGIVGKGEDCRILGPKGSILRVGVLMAVFSVEMSLVWHFGRQIVDESKALA